MRYLTRVLIVFGFLCSLTNADPCTDYNDETYGKSGKCISKSCCEYSYYNSDLCSGSDACCFTRNTCASGGCPSIVSRAGWDARASKSNTYLSSPVSYVFIHHGDGDACNSQSECSATARGYQDFHMDTKGWNDIAYSFLVGEDGNAYEGRGWDRVGAHTPGYNDKALAICVIGNFNSRLPNAAALNTVKRLIQCGIEKGKISQNYVLRGHRDVDDTDCPGDVLYPEIKTWSNY